MYNAQDAASIPLLDGDEAPPRGGGGALSIPRARLLEVLHRRAERSASCARVPFALLMYAFTCYLIILHGHASTAYELESTLYQQAVGSGSGGGFLQEVQSANSWLDYFAGDLASDPTATLVADSGWINAVLSNRDDGVLIADVDRRGRIRDTIKIIGGVHLTQTRRELAPCGVKGIRSLYGLCHSGVSRAPFGSGSFTNGAIDVSAAFRPSPATTNPGGNPNATGVFQYWLDVTATRATNQATLVQLDAAGWLDSATASVAVEFAVLNGEIGFVGRVALRAAFGAGGRVETSAAVTSLPIDPYGMYPQLRVLDTFAVIWLLYCATSLLHSVSAALAAGDYAALLSYWFLLDYVSTGALVAAVAQYGGVVGALAGLGLDPAALPSAYAKGCSACPATYDCCSVGNNILAASERFEAFKSTAVLYLICATLRLFYFFTLQPRLAVFPDAFARAFPDLLHFGILFGVVMTMFGVWGHFLFGSLAPDWHTVSGSITTVFRLMNWDYDLVIMEQKNKGFADAYLVFALYGVTNLLLWALVGIIFEFFSVVMNERAASPSVLDELYGAWLGARAALSAPGTCLRWLSVQANVAPPRAYGPSGASADGSLPPLPVVTAALAPGGALAHVPAVTPELLAAALGVSLPAAAGLIVSVLAARPADAAAGWEAPLPPDVLAALGELQAALGSAAAASYTAIGGEEGGGGGGGGSSSSSSSSSSGKLRSPAQLLEFLAARAEAVRSGSGAAAAEAGEGGAAAMGQLLAKVTELNRKVELLLQQQQRGGGSDSAGSGGR